MASNNTRETSGPARPLEETFWIKPSTPVPAQKIFLPPGDQVGVPIIVSRVNCFRRDETVLSEERFVQALKVAVANAIADFPHLCGKITYADEATRRLQLEIPEGTSVELRVKRHPDKSADEYERLNWPPHMLRRDEITFSKYPIPGIGTFSIAFQANLIKGGVILCSHMNHVHFDGFGHSMLIDQVLAHHVSRAIDGLPEKPSGIVTPESLDKSSAYGTHPARPILEWEDWRAAPPKPVIEGLSPEELMQMYVASMSEFTLTVWRVSPEKQEKLRRESQGPEGQKLSLASCLHSLLWKVYVRARNQDPDTRTRCLFPVQTRGRVPGLHKMYSGSALVYGRSELRAREVLSLSKNEVGRRIEAGTARWTPEHIREYWGSIEDCKNLADIEPNTDRQDGTDVEFSNITTFPFYRLHWGVGLDVAAYRTTELAFTDAYILLTPKRSNGDIEVFMYMNKDSLANALRDPQWRDYAEYVCAGNADIDVQVANSPPLVRAKL